MMPVLASFVANPTAENFAAAMQAYKTQCQHWPLWKRHCSEVIGVGKLSLDDIAYSNCLPWRTESQSNFDDSVAFKALKLYVEPLFEELQPRLIIALGKRAASILRHTQKQLPEMVVWNRAQAATITVKQERAEAAERILQLL